MSCEATPSFRRYDRQFSTLAGETSSTSTKNPTVSSPTFAFPEAVFACQSRLRRNKRSCLTESNKSFSHSSRMHAVDGKERRANVAKTPYGGIKLSWII